MNEAGKYLYGIIQSANNESFGCIGINNSEVYAIQYEGVGAVVSDIPENYEMNAEETRIHEKTLRKIMEAYTVIPVRFGVIAKNEEEIKNILKRAQVKFKNMLEKINNKIQINVKISWDNAILSSLLSENKEIWGLSQEAKEKNDLPLRIELGKKIKSTLDERKNKYLQNIQEALQSLSDGFTENKIIDPDTLIHASFLVDKKQEQGFYKKLDELEKKYQKKLNFLCISPLPPYNFTRFEIKKIDFNAIDKARKTFGFNQEASISEINSAYELFAQEYHPDLHPDNPFAEEKFKKIKAAHELLINYCEHYLCSLKKSKVEETLLIQEKA